jgi:hypothetical protein
VDWRGAYCKVFGHNRHPYAAGGVLEVHCLTCKATLRRVDYRGHYSFNSIHGAYVRDPEPKPVCKVLDSGLSPSLPERNDRTGFEPELGGQT